MYLALYRKYRPKTFDQVIGQNHIIKTLQNQITLDKVGHAYLFCGSRGTGKTSTAKIFAKEINCTCGGGGNCAFCNNNLSLDILEIDAASNNGVDEIRDLREKVKYPPVDGKYKVYIIDEVHMLSPSAFNALLKTLEEPPKHAVFILATTEVHKLPATILSRCMRFDFKLVSVEELAELLKKIFTLEGVEFDEQSVNLIARAGEGSVRDTLSIADRCVSFAGNKLSANKVVEVLGATEKQSLIDIADTLLNKTVGEAIMQLDKVLSGGKSPLVLSKDLVYYFRDLLIINTLKEKAASVVVASKSDYQQMVEQATDANYAKITKTIELLSSVEADLRYSVQPRIVLETCIIRLFEQQSLQERIEKLEQIIASGNFVRPQTMQAAQTQPVKFQETKVEVKTQEPVQTVKQETLPAAGEKLLGQILTYLREQKLMSLLMACRQINKIVVSNNVAKLFIKDSAAISMINNERYSKILNDYLNNFGLKFEVANTASSGGDLGELSSKLGGRLEIK